MLSSLRERETAAGTEKPNTWTGLWRYWGSTAAAFSWRCRLSCQETDCCEPGRPPPITLRRVQKAKPSTGRKFGALTRQQRLTKTSAGWSRNLKKKKRKRRKSCNQNCLKYICVAESQESNNFFSDKNKKTLNFPNVTFPSVQLSRLPFPLCKFFLYYTTSALYLLALCCSKQNSPHRLEIKQHIYEYQKKKKKSTKQTRKQQIGKRERKERTLMWECRRCGSKGNEVSPAFPSGVYKLSGVTRNVRETQKAN